MSQNWVKQAECTKYTACWLSPRSQVASLAHVPHAPRARAARPTFPSRHRAPHAPVPSRAPERRCRTAHLTPVLPAPCLRTPPACPCAPRPRAPAPRAPPQCVRAPGSQYPSACALARPACAPARPTCVPCAPSLLLKWAVAHFRFCIPFFFPHFQ